MTKLLNGVYVDEIVMANEMTSDAGLTQVITVPTAGTPVQGPAVSNPAGWWIKAAPGNTGTVFFMFFGQTSAAKGFPLSAGQTVAVQVANLAAIGFDASVSGEKIHACKI